MGVEGRTDKFSLTLRQTQALESMANISHDGTVATLTDVCESLDEIRNAIRDLYPGRLKGEIRLQDVYDVWAALPSVPGRSVYFNNASGFDIKLRRAATPAGEWTIRAGEDFEIGITANANELELWQADPSSVPINYIVIE